MKNLLAAPTIVLLATLLAACGEDASTGSTPTVTCTYTEEGTAAKEVDLPPSEAVGVDQLTLETNRGDITVMFDPSAACTVNSFVSLAQQGYFDDTKCHRLVPGFVLQCGDPSATGMGGPGYSFADELDGDETYPAGTFAMANSGEDTNGSQFFIVLEDASLPPAYTVFGSVDADGLQVALDIAAEGNGPDGVSPAQDVVIEKVS